MIHRRFIHFDIGLKEILQNTPRIEMDFVSILPCAQPTIFLRERIHDPVSVTRIAFMHQLKTKNFSLSFRIFSFITLVPGADPGFFLGGGALSLALLQLSYSGFVFTVMLLDVY